MLKKPIFLDPTSQIWQDGFLRFSPPMCETCMVEVQVGQVQVFPETTSSRPKPNDGAHTPVNSPVPGLQDMYNVKCVGKPTNTK